MFWAKLLSNASHLSENAFLCWTIGQKNIFKTYCRDLCPSINFLVLYCRLLSIIAGESGGGLFIIRKCPNKCLITFILCLTCWTQIRKKNILSSSLKKEKKKELLPTWDDDIWAVGYTSSSKLNDVDLDTYATTGLVAAVMDYVWLLTTTLFSVWERMLAEK